MQEPWKKHGGWPYEGRRGKSWQLGYRDHEGRVRAKSFKTKSDAGVWSKGYIKADRQGRLREFLLGSDAPEVQPDTTPVGELILDWLATDAHPDSPGGLARSTWDSYRSVASRHVIGNPVERELKKTGEIVEVEPAIKPLGQQGGYAIGRIPAVQFETADVLKRWVQGNAQGGRERLGRGEGMEGALVRSLVGCRGRQLAALDERLSDDAAAARYATGLPSCRHRSGPPACVGQAPRRSRVVGAVPLAVERIRLVMLERLDQRSPLLALRDATVVSVQYGLGMRNQEVWALTLGDVAGRRASVREVLSYGALDAGKTEGATGPSRRPPIDALLADDLVAWKAALAGARISDRR